MTLPRTVAEVLDLLLGQKDSGPKGFDEQTPTRLSHAAALLEQGADPAAVDAAVERLNASGWLRKPAREVTARDLARLRRERPWDLAKTRSEAGPAPARRKR